jgi:2-succinyl-5-enolpyruvyl-6-hydroxy-3-cyclohexene-1-carboxylate synthase
MLANSVQHFWAKQLAESLRINAIDTICIAPGSRSTCLVKAISEEESFKIVTHYDERSLGFFALGVAKDTKKPVVVITTSGSAITNLIPACVEALNLQTPLLLITADRPLELQNCGANQTLNQCELLRPACIYQEHIDTPCNDTKKYKSFIKKITVAISQSFNGPVHINMSFREPFFSQKKSYNSLLQTCDLIPAKKISNFKKQAKFSLVYNKLSPKKTVCIIACTRNDINKRYLLTWAKNNNIALLAEATSSLGYSSDQLMYRVDELVNLMFEQNILPDTLICIGSKWVSSQIHKLIKHVNKGVIIHDFNASQDWQKTDLYEFINCDLTNSNFLPNYKQDESYLTQIKALKVSKSKVFTQELTYESCFSSLNKTLEDYSSIFIGNSLAVRLLNKFFNPQKKSINVFSQRGVSGIDGLISTAAGVGFTNQDKIAVIIGDISYLYDINGLYFFSKQVSQADIFVINNNGGRIFETLPIKNDPILNPLFVMPHNLSLQHSAYQFNISYELVENIDQLNALKKNKQPKSRVIELKLQ